MSVFPHFIHFLPHGLRYMLASVDLRVVWTGSRKGKRYHDYRPAVNHLCMADNLLPSEGFLLTFCIFRMLSGCVRTNRSLLRMDLHDAEKGQNGRQKSLKNAFQGILSTVHKRKHHL